MLPYGTWLKLPEDTRCPVSKKSRTAGPHDGVRSADPDGDKKYAVRDPDGVFWPLWCVWPYRTCDIEYHACDLHTWSIHTCDFISFTCVLAISTWPTLVISIFDKAILVIYSSYLWINIFDHAILAIWGIILAIDTPYLWFTNLHLSYLWFSIL